MLLHTQTGRSSFSEYLARLINLLMQSGSELIRDAFNLVLIYLTHKHLAGGKMPECTHCSGCFSE